MQQQIVLVDDDRDIRHVLTEILYAEGYAPSAFPRAEEALESIKVFPPALLITDVLMPGMSGHELIAKTRALHGAALPILVMSASANQAAAIARLPTQAFLGKPFDLDEFSTLVGQLVTNAHTPADAPRRVERARV